MSQSYFVGIEKQLHLNVRTGVRRGGRAMGRKVSKANRFVQADGGRHLTVGFEKEASGAGRTCCGDHPIEEAAADAGPAKGFGYRHLGNPVLPWAHGAQRAADDS